MTGPDRATARRRATHEAGHMAERLALLALALKGYRILARRYVVKGGEIDLVVRRGDTVVFVEVKARPTRTEALAALTPVKRRRIDRAAATWLAANPWAVRYNLRADAMVVTPRRWPEQVKDAFGLQVGL